ncbi:hypothetical protein G7046_g6256 [Stylonectria norvegica]|nr:hypothetical protein G7046_g6256 [Stylonectria norvegica]
MPPTSNVGQWMADCGQVESGSRPLQKSKWRGLGEDRRGRVRREGSEAQDRSEAIARDDDDSDGQGRGRKGESDGIVGESEGRRVGGRRAELWLKWRAQAFAGAHGRGRARRCWRCRTLWLKVPLLLAVLGMVATGQRSQEGSGRSLSVGCVGEGWRLLLLLGAEDGGLHSSSSELMSRLDESSRGRRGEVRRGEAKQVELVEHEYGAHGAVQLQ